MGGKYVHGYDRRESTRLSDQAVTLADLLHYDTVFPAGSKILEVGCGIGAQTVTLAKKNPEAYITSIDINEGYLAKARDRVESEGLENVKFQQGDVLKLDFEAESFDYIFLCFVLEHLPEPGEVLCYLKPYIKPGGGIMLIEGDHGSTYFYPDNEASHKAIQSLVELQRRCGGNALIGRELYPLLIKAGYGQVKVSPRMVYVDSSKPEFVEGFTRKTFAAMIEGVREEALKAGIIEEEVFDEGVKGLYRAAEDDGVFCYTFFKATAKKK